MGYIRVHGRNYNDWFRKKAPVDQRYNYLYRADQLEPWVERTREMAADPATREVYVVTNNHYKGKAVANALGTHSRTMPSPRRRGSSTLASIFY